MSTARPSRSRPAESPDLLVCALVLLVGGVMALIPAPAAVRAVFEVPLVVFVPGYLVMAAAFGVALPEPLLRAVLGVALSLAICACGAVGLNALGAELDRSWFTCVLVLVGAVALVVASRRREYALPAWRGGRWPRRMRAEAVLVCLVIAVLGAGIAAVRAPTTARSVAGSSTVWALPASGGDAVIGVRSMELRPTAFRADIVADGKLAGRLQFRLQPGASWQRRIAIPAGADVRLQLSRGPDLTTVYRQVQLPTEGN